MLNVNNSKAFVKAMAAMALAAAAALFACSCNNTQVTVQKTSAAYLITQPILLITPISNLQGADRTCDSLGNYFQIETQKRVKGTVKYSKEVPGLSGLATFGNLVKNGDINTNEAAAMAKTIGCQSVIVIQVVEYKQYPPFKMVVAMHWIDADTGNTIGKVYNDVDTSDSQINYRYKCFSGQGPLKEIYEEFQFSEDLYQTASLMPEKFKLFVATFTANVMFKTAEDSSWQFWRIL